MPQEQDVILIARLRNNDMDAFDELYLKYFKLLCASAYFFLNNESEAKDVVQNLFIDIWERKLFQNFHDDVKGYLFLSVKNRCLNLLKSQKVKGRKEDAIIAEGQTFYTNFEEEQSVPDCNEKLQYLLSNMKGQKQAAVRIVYLDGKKYKDAAHEMGISINSLKTHLKSALKMLRMGMGDKNH